MKPESPSHIATEPRLAVIVPARNEALRLPAQLDALANQTSDELWELVVVDNGSTDDTAEIARRYSGRIPGLQVVRENEPGICAARRAGVRAASAPNVAFCDADDVVAPEWVAAMLSAIEAFEIATGPLDPDALNAVALRSMRGRQHEESVPTFYGVFPYPHGGNFAIRRETLDRIGHFDPRYSGGEDVEFGLRAWLAGVEVGFAPEATVAYRYATSPRQLWRQGFGYGRVRPLIRDLLVRRGCPAPGPFAGWRSWLLLVARLPTAATQSGRCTVAWIAGNRIGQLVGSLSARRLFL